MSFLVPKAKEPGAAPLPPDRTNEEILAAAQQQRDRFTPTQGGANYASGVGYPEDTAKRFAKLLGDAGR